MKSTDESKKIIEALPLGISEYLKEHFREDFLTETKKTINKAGKVTYNVQVSSQNSLYHLKFNSKGILIEKEMEPILELYDEEYGIVD